MYREVLVCSVPIPACPPWQNLRAFKRDCRLLVLLANAVGLRHDGTPYQAAQDAFLTAYSARG